MKKFAIAAVVAMMVAMSVSAVVAAEANKEKTIKVYRVYEDVSIELPPGLGFEIDGRFLSHMEVEANRTRIHLNSKSIEIYAKPAGKEPKGVKIEAFQVGPGFYADPAWKIIYGQ